jgi:hypothetical protein
VINILDSTIVIPFCPVCFAASNEVIKEIRFGYLYTHPIVTPIQKVDGNTDEAIE